MYQIYLPRQEASLEVIIHPLRGGFWPFQGSLIIVLSDYSFETA